MVTAILRSGAMTGEHASRFEVEHQDSCEPPPGSPLPGVEREEPQSQTESTRTPVRRRGSCDAGARGESRRSRVKALATADFSRALR